MTVRRLAAKDCLQSCGLTSKGLSLCLFELNYQDTRQKDRSKKRIHSVNPFCFVVFRPQSLLDFLESRVMKRKSINHCQSRSEMERWTRTPEGT